MTARDMLARILGQTPTQVVYIAQTGERLITVVVALADREETSRLIGQAGWEYVDLTAALSLEDMRKIAEAAR